MRHGFAAAAATLALAAAGCGGGDETGDRVVRAVPVDARAYVHYAPESGDWERALDALSKLPALETALGGLLPDPPAEIEDEQGLAYLPGEPEPATVHGGSEELDPNLGDAAPYVEILRGLPDERLTHAYLARAALGPLRAIDPSVMAAGVAADVDEDLMRVRMRAVHDREGGPCTEGGADTGLVDLAPPDAALYVEMPSIACALRTLAAQADGGGEALGRLARAAERRGGVSLQDELLPLLDRRGALIATPGESAPTFTLLVEDVDEQQALDVLARLQPALIRLLGTEDIGQVPAFGATDVEGITAATAQLAPGLELSYAAWDGRLVVSTSLAGIAQARRAGGLPGSDTFESVLGDRPEAPSALVFADLNQLLALGEQAGLAEDPSYLAVRDDLQKLRAAGAVLSREEKFTTAELTFHIP